MCYSSFQDFEFGGKSLAISLRDSGSGTLANKLYDISLIKTGVSHESQKISRRFKRLESEQAYYTHYLMAFISLTIKGMC